MTILVPMSAAHRRSVFVVVALLICLHYLLSMSHEEYSQWTSLGRLRAQWHISESTVVFGVPDDVDTRYAPQAAPSLYNNTPAVIEPTGPKRANATLVFLCRNNELDSVISSVEQMEAKFNKKFKYPWVFLNEEPFTAEFRKRVSVLTDAPISFGLIPREDWFQPEWIDEGRATDGRNKMQRQGIIYAGSVPYRNMCRFNSGFFFKHELLQQYKWYWRVEPDVRYYCDLDYDPFLFMEENNKIYGFTMSMPEWEPTIPTLWDSVKEFISENPEYVAEDNAMDFLSENSGESYNLCHFWSNFEIADMDFWRGDAYQAFFDHLEAKGGFYYERWGDAPIHSIAVSLFANKDQIHFFKDIGYKHSSFQHCPQGKDWRVGHCSCDPNDNFDYAQNSCLRHWQRLF